MDEQTALSKGMEQKAEEFVKQCGQLYLEKQCEPDPNSSGQSGSVPKNLIFPIQLHKLSWTANADLKAANGISTISQFPSP